MAPPGLADRAGCLDGPAELVSAADDVHRLDPGLAERLLREAASSGSTTARLAHARILVRLGRSADADLVLDGLAEVEDLDRDQELDLAVARGYNRFWGLRDVVGACDAIGETVDDGSDTRPGPWHCGASRSCSTAGTRMRLRSSSPCWSRPRAGKGRGPDRRCGRRRDRRAAVRPRG